MKYFLHDTNAFQDEKITELFIKFGYEGIGLFFTILEKLALHEKPMKTEVLKKQLYVGKKLEKCWLFLESSQLISSNNGETFNENLLKFSEKFQIKKEKNRERISKWRENQAVKENVTRYETVCNTPKDKVKESKVKESIEDKSSIHPTPSPSAGETEGKKPPESNSENSAPPAGAPPENGAYSKYIPPKMEEVVSHFQDRGLDEDEASDFYREYSGRDWFDKAGRKMSNWQLTANTWIKNAKESARRRDLVTQQVLEKVKAGNVQVVGAGRREPESQFDKRNNQYMDYTSPDRFDAQGKKIQP